MKRTTFICHICNYINKTKSAHRTHLKCKHNYENSGVHCLACDKYYKNETAIIKHKLTKKHLRNALL